MLVTVAFFSTSQQWRSRSLIGLSAITFLWAEIFLRAWLVTRVTVYQDLSVGSSQGSFVPASLQFVLVATTSLTGSETFVTIMTIFRVAYL